MPPKHMPEVNALIDRMMPTKAHRRVFDLMCARTPKGYRGQGNYARWRTIDVQQATGHNSDENRLRELRERFPELFLTHHCTYRDRGGSHNEYQLRRGWVEILKRYERGAP